MTTRDAMLVAVADHRDRSPAEIVDAIESELSSRSYLVVPVPSNDGATELIAQAREFLAHRPFGWGPIAHGIVKQLCGSLDRHRAWVADLMAGTYINCVYCGHRYGPSATTPASMADVLKAHIAECTEHPMSELLRVCGAASHALKSYAHGNASPDLAVEVAAAVDAAIAGAKGPSA